mgnify:CR=1 FL=1
MTLRLTLENAACLPATVIASIEFGAREQLTIGRSPSAGWTLPDPSRLLSGKHCEIRRVGEQYLLSDLSSNGTFIEGTQTRISSPHRLHDGDLLLMGNHRVRVELADESKSSADSNATRIVPQPAVEPMLQLTVQEGAEALGQSAPTARLGRHGVLRIGRDDGADWILPDRGGGVSRQHCTIRCRDDSFVLEDTSSNGTFINDDSQRTTGPYSLRDGDQLLIGSYLIAVKISALPTSMAAVSSNPGTSTAPAERSAASADRPSPVRRSGKVQRGGDPAAMLDTGIPAPPAAEAPAATMADTVTRLAPAARRAPADAKARRSGEAQATATMRVAVAPTGDTASPSAATDDPVLTAIAKGLGLSPSDLHDRDPAALGERLAGLILLLTGELRELLSLRDAVLERPPVGRTSATASNPLAIMPTSEEALRVVFGPPRKAYLDGRQSFQQCLRELHDHLQQTGSALRCAARVLNGELAPHAIERDVPAESRFGQLLVSRKARLWEVYVERWNQRLPLQSERQVASFLERFAGDKESGGGTGSH